jgi:hypothetical protein
VTRARSEKARAEVSRFADQLTKIKPTTPAGAAAVLRYMIPDMKDYTTAWTGTLRRHCSRCGLWGAA